MDNIKSNRGGGVDCQISHFVPNFGRNLNFINQSKNKKKAFTLAEVLITLVIIGVVAALTIPSVITNYKKHQVVTQLKKTYTTLSQATNNSVADHGPINTWEFDTGNTKVFVEKYILPYLNIAKNCGYNSDGDCKLERADMNTPNNLQEYGEDFYKIILNDGSSVSFSNNSQTVSGTYLQTYCQVDIDVNGKKGPNIYGKDVFMYVIWVQFESATGENFAGKFMANGGTSNNRANIAKNWCNRNKKGHHCAKMIMMDGWQMKDDYPWP